MDHVAFKSIGLDSDLHSTVIHQVSQSLGIPGIITRPISLEIPQYLSDVSSWHQHIPFAFWMIEALRPRILVELGTHKGDSYCAFLQAIEQLKLVTACYAVDNWQGDEHAGHYNQLVFEQLRQYHDSRYGGFSRLVRSNFDDAVDQFEDGCIDLLHVDGFHSYEAVCHDFAHWHKKLSERAVVLFHDVNVREADFGVWRFWEEIKDQYPSFTFLHGHGLGVLAYGSDLAPAVRSLVEFDEEEAARVRSFFYRLGLAVQDRGNASSVEEARGRVALLEASLNQARAQFERESRENLQRIGELIAQVQTANQMSDMAARDRDRALGARNDAIWERDHAKWERDVAHAERDEARLERNASNAQRDAAREQARLASTQTRELSESARRHALQLNRELSALRNSASWKLSQPMRNLARKISRRGLEAETNPDSPFELMQATVAIRQSISWELMAPLRLMFRLIPPRTIRNQEVGSQRANLEPAGDGSGIEILAPVSGSMDGEHKPVSAPAKDPAPPPPLRPDVARTSVEDTQDFYSIKKDVAFDHNFYVSPLAPSLSRDEAIRTFLRQRLGKAGNRKPMAGFNAEIYAAEALTAAERETRNPFVDFIEKGKPTGPWLSSPILPPSQSPLASRLRIALHVHAFYADLALEFLTCMAANQSCCDLLVSTTTEPAMASLRNALKGYTKGTVRISVVPNRGRDLGPFLTEYNFLDGKYDLVGHVHFKKSAHITPQFGEVWRHFLWRNLLGPDHPMLDQIARSFEDDASLGLVFPDDPYMPGWSSDKALGILLAAKMKLGTELPDAFEFPVGTMFWCRPDALRAIFKLGPSWEDYPAEPLPIDGTMLHALERLLPFAVTDAGYRTATTHIPGLTR